MLSAPHRVRRSADFSAAVRQGRRAGRTGLVVHLLADSTEATRAGFIVGRGVGGAVVRNRVKRRLRHLVAERLERLPTGATLVVRALPPSAGYTFEELGRDLDSALRRVIPGDR